MFSTKMMPPVKFCAIDPNATMPPLPGFPIQEGCGPASLRSRLAYAALRAFGNGCGYGTCVRWRASTGISMRLCGPASSVPSPEGAMSQPGV